MPHALIVEDHPATLDGMAKLVAREGFSVSAAKSLSRARKAIHKKHPDVVLLDLKLPDGDGLELIAALDEDGSGLVPLPEIVLITGNASIDTAVEAMRMGAADYLTKPVDARRLRAVLSNVARTAALRGEVARLREELRQLGRFGELIGASPPMQKVYERIGRVAPTSATVLITGASGSGKEMAARTIHQLSRRADGPFCALNCGAVTENLIESELFGHERGAFTGAHKRHRGVFEQAKDGTLFLDEISEMPTALQVKLLRVLETKSITRVGGEGRISANARLIAATNRDVEEAVREGKLREDLYYRLNVFSIELPRLHRRGDDLILLAQHFLDELNAAEGTSKHLAENLPEVLAAHSWPGNVRELKNAIHSAFILADDVLEPAMVPEEVMMGTVHPPGLRVRVGVTVAEAERSLILATIAECDGNKSRAAEILGISLRTIYNRLNSYEGTAVPTESSSVVQTADPTFTPRRHAP